MKLTKLSNYSTTVNGYSQEVGHGEFRNITQTIDDYASTADTDLSNIFTALKGRIRFGTGVDGARGENIEGEFQVFITTSTGGTVVNHTLSATPIGFLIVSKNANSELWLASATTASITFASNNTGTSFTVFLLK